ncbi:MAG: DegV family protein [Bacillota bacterium]
MPVHIVTDSTADIPPELVTQHNITVVPLKVLFGEEVFRDGVDISIDAFYERLVKEKSTTSQPSPGDFLEVYSRLTENGDSVISIHISAALSGTMQSARLARSMLPDRNIETVDSRLTSIALGMIVLEAARAAEAGLDHEVVSDLVHRLMESTEVYFMVDTLEYLHRGGRIGKAQALLGTLLNLKPVLQLKDGIVQPFEKVRGRAKALDTVVRTAVFASNKYGPLNYTILHGNVPEIARELEEKLVTQLGYEPYLVCRVGAVIGTHTGPGVAGLVFYPRSALTGTDSRSG